MKSFVIGQIIEPEIREVKVKGETRKILNFGLLSGKSCESFDVWGDDKIFAKASALKQGDVVLAVVGSSVDAKKMSIRYFLNSVAPCPNELRKSLLAAVSNE